MFRRFAFLTVILLACAPISAHAQTTSSEAHFPKVQTTVVTFAVTGRVESSTAETLGLPAALLERLSRQSALARMNVGGDTWRQDLVLRFVFPSMQAFQAWHTSAETRGLMQDLKSAARGPLSTSLAVKRPPLSDLAGDL